MLIRRIRKSDHAEWLRMRRALWPSSSAAEHETEMARILDDASRWAVFVAARPDRRLSGFVEVSVREQAEGCRTHPVGYIEFWYVDPDTRRQGVGRQLLAAAETWARGRGCREMASDTGLDNVISQGAHRAAGYAEVDRQVHFRKELAPQHDGQ